MAMFFFSLKAATDIAFVENNVLPVLLKENIALTKLCSANLLVEYSTVCHYFTTLNSIEFWLFQRSIWLSCLLVQPVFELNFLVFAQYGCC